MTVDPVYSSEKEAKGMCQHPVLAVIVEELEGHCVPPCENYDLF